MDRTEALSKSYTILGAGRSGAGIAVYLKKHGAKVFLSESLPKEKLLFLDESILQKESIEYEVGGHTDRVYENEIIIKSPGIPLEAEVLKRASDSGKRIIGEIEIASLFCDAPIVAITGTNGKTTTAVLTGEIFKNAGIKTKVCGNVGLAFSEILDDIDDKSVVVLETSSFQLESTDTFKPKVAIIINITPDHIDWHGSFENYVTSKLKINKNQDSKDITAINYDDETLQKLLPDYKGKVCTFSLKGREVMTKASAGAYLEDGKIFYFDNEKGIDELIIDSKDIFIKGRHNIYNSMGAIIASKAFGLKNEVIVETLKTFKGVEHRIEPVRTINEVTYYNDSKATNFDSTYVALESFPSGIVLIMGGKKGDNNFNKVKEYIKERVLKIYAIGQSKEAIAEFFSGSNEVEKCETLQEAVEKANKFAKPGNVVLFSPAYKSFDMFDNYEHRGEEFKKYVNLL